MLVLYVSTSVLGKTATRFSDNIDIVNQAILPLIYNLQNSIDANHGWVTVGGEEYLQKNKLAWVQIDQSLDELVSVYRSIDEANYQQMVNGIKEKVEELSKLQLAIGLINTQHKAKAIERVQAQAQKSQSAILDVLDQLRDIGGVEKDSQLAKLVDEINLHIVQSVMQVELMVSQQGVIGTKEYAEYQSLQAQHHQLLSKIETLEIDTWPSQQLVVRLISLIKELNVLLNDIVVEYRAANNTHVRDFLFYQAVP